MSSLVSKARCSASSSTTGAWTVSGGEVLVKVVMVRDVGSLKDDGL